MLEDSKNEREVESVFNMRGLSNDVGYNVIAASGANACILHWGRNDGAIKKNDLVLLDAGIELEELYRRHLRPLYGGGYKPQRRAGGRWIPDEAVKPSRFRPIYRGHEGVAKNR